MKIILMTIILSTLSSTLFANCNVFIEKGISANDRTLLETTLNEKKFNIVNNINSADVIFESLFSYMNHYQDTYMVTSFNTDLVYILKQDRDPKTGFIKIDESVPNLPGTVTNVHTSDRRVFQGSLPGFWWNQENWQENSLKEALEEISDCGI